MGSAIHKIFLLFTVAVLYSANIFATPLSAADIPCETNYVFCLNEFLDIASKNPTVEQAIAQLPINVKRNVTFKRGNNIEKTINGRVVILGPHGHLAPTNESSSATPAQPRVLVWDEKSGFTASWNSGNPEHSADDRVDLYDFDFDTKKHRLLSWTQKGGLADAHAPDNNGRRCVDCHGEVQRPIFPMYPDWPQFYGEFNDEMAGYAKTATALRSDLKIIANDFQPKERAFYFDFLKGEASNNPRYTPLFAVKPNDGNLFYPYRPRTTFIPSTDVSRAFAYRPNLRIGVMYNRLTALQVFEKIKHSAVFKKFPDILFYSLLDCNWDFSTKSGSKERTQILSTLLAGTADADANLKDLNLRGAAFSADDLKNLDTKTFIEVKNSNGKSTFYKSKAYTEANYRQIPYEDLLQLLGLQLADMDLRFRHDSSITMGGKFNVYDARAFSFTNSAMDIGYIKESYALNPICDNNNSTCKFTYDGTYMQGMRYFNSYFDGSATMNELLAAQILLYLTDVKQDFSNEPELAAVRALLVKAIPTPQIYFETLAKKYASFTDRLALDKTFFSRMDTLSPWIQLPFPPDLLNIHNREAFWGNGSKTLPIRMRHAQWLSVDDRNKDIQNRNGGNNLCWNIYDSMKIRYVKD